MRPEYAGGATLTTKPVDLSRVITGWTGDSDRTRRWGFDAAHIPLNAQVWYPEGPGPYPLALIVHGNKSSVEFSEAGFAYLAEHLASQGTVVASIDANFLSTTLLDRSGGIGGADLARALLPLEHLQAWQQLATAGPLKGRVDLTKVALIGHSRGGEAVAVAAMLQPRDTVPGQEDVRLDYDVPIRSVVALAPADGQFTAGGAKVQLKDVDYLAIQGSHDVDVASFGGLNQLARTTLGRDDLGATLYLGGGDHSQFNTLWGRRDLGDGAAKYVIDTGRLITPEQQRAATMRAVSAFLATTLRGADQSSMFADNRSDDSLRTIASLRSGRDGVLLDAQGPDKTVGTKGVTVAGSGLPRGRWWRSPCGGVRATTGSSASRAPAGASTSGPPRRSRSARRARCGSNSPRPTAANRPPSRSRSPTPPDAARAPPSATSRRRSSPTRSRRRGCSPAHRANRSYRTASSRPASSPPPTRTST